MITTYSHAPVHVIGSHNRYTSLTKRKQILPLLFKLNIFTYIGHIMTQVHNHTTLNVQHRIIVNIIIILINNKSNYCRDVKNSF